MPPYSQDSPLAASSSSQPPPPPPAPSMPPPKKLDVASGILNLGNTCYMNAVLQALAHCQELNMAVELEPHSATCPVARSRPKSASPSPDSVGRTGTRKSARNGKKSPSPDSFCALCEFEHHLRQVHSSSATEPVAPLAFVNGFIDHVAPHFKLGVQEDSHEFLRLLIDAMQKSCTKARSASSTSEDDTEYPFQLFRGTVESKVQCESCQATSSTIDPIEDIGLDVSANSNYGKVTPPPNALADVSSAFTKFKAEENLEGYKCEKCGKTGKATKQSRLASIPPILTLHLKRFRYGTSTEEVAARRRSEISQLLSSRDFASTSGKSGSAKIEGHVKFEELFDLRPFLTESLKEQHKRMFCRLFAVIVHAGANSHSGHYICYVKNMNKANEWWKMDDARISRVSNDEVMGAEAYMLLYRTLQHPTIMSIQERHKEFVANAVTRASSAEPPATKQAGPSTADAAEQSTVTESSDKKRKRDLQEFVNGEEWAANKTRLPPSVLPLLRRVEEFVADNAEVGAKFFSSRIEENAKKERGPPDTIGGTLLLSIVVSRLVVVKEY